MSEKEREEEVYFLERQEKIQAASVLHLLQDICSDAAGHSTVVEQRRFIVLFELFFELVSPIGLLGNLSSIISVADRWRFDTIAKHTIPDVWWVITFNSVSLALGCIANATILLHMDLKITRLTSLGISFACYMTAVLIYIAILIASQYHYFGNGVQNISRTMGFWQAVCGISLYFVAAMFILAHIWYFRGHKWNIALSHRQHQLMVLCLIYFAWISIGAACFQQKAMLDISYGDGVYFIVVTFLTLGYGDIVARNNLSRALIIPFSFFGVLIGGLVSVCVFQATLESANSRSVSAGIERDRIVSLNEWEINHLNDRDMSDRCSFEKMRRISDIRRMQQAIVVTVLKATWLAAYWLIGALVFKYTEHWHYFDAFYMCFISTLTIGYGDFTPASNGGRAFLIYWGVIALPTMAAVVSGITSLCMLLIQERERIVKTVDNLCHTQLSRRYGNKRRRSLTSKYFATRKGSDPKIWQFFLEIADSKDGTKFSYEVWSGVICSLFEIKSLPPSFWLTEMSPLRVPCLDEKRLLTLLSMHVLTIEENAIRKCEQHKDTNE